MEEMTASAQDRRALWTVFGITFAYLIVEIVTGLLTNSLALIADAVHMFTDAGALALAAFASWMAERPATPQRTYGYYRVEILAALANAVILTGSAVYIIYEAYQRLLQPSQVIGLPVMIAAVVGLIVNLIGIWILRGRSQENLNVQGAFYEVVKDALGSVGVIIAGAVILTTQFYLIDPIVSILIAVFILPRTWGLLTDAIHILLEATPARISLGAVRESMLEVDGVAAVHDLHVWTITSGFVAMSGHVVVEAGVDKYQAQKILQQINTQLDDEFEIKHTTIQIEFQDIQEQEPQT